jgi:hypothetical protein
MSKREKEKESDPWGASYRTVDALLSEREISVPNFFTKKQVKMFSQLTALSVLYKQYLLRLQGEDAFKTITWLDVLIEEYMRLLKAEDGKAVKLASRVAVSGQSKVMLNLQRVKERLVGRESSYDYET